MSIQDFCRRFTELDGRFAEQEAYIAEANGKRIRWQVLFSRPLSDEQSVTVSFNVPAARPGDRFYNVPVLWASFPSALRARIYGFRRDDVVEIEAFSADRGVLVLPSCSSTRARSRLSSTRRQLPDQAHSVSTLRPLESAAGAFQNRRRHRGARSSSLAVRCRTSFAELQWQRRSFGEDASSGATEVYPMPR